MSERSRVSHPIYNLLPTEIEGFDSLAELALDMRWSWNHATDHVWRQLDPELWESTNNPWVVLQTVSRDRIERVLADPAFRTGVDVMVQAKRQAAEAPAWFQKNHADASLTCAAYFSMEFMLSEALPIYSGGLGNVAGDQLKAASDLGVPIAGVGLLYQQDYFRQAIDKNGEQEALYPYSDPGQLPITPLRQPNGEWLRLEIALPGYSVWVRGWQVQVGRTKLYLLDSNDAANFPAHRGITSELYGGGPELRLKQELLLGIGGWRLLRALGIQPEVWHLNEGHAAFAVLERARSFMEETGQPFEAALAATRAGNLFTTHTRGLLIRQTMEYPRSISSIPMAFTCKSRPETGAERSAASGTLARNGDLGSFGPQRIRRFWTNGRLLGSNFTTSNQPTCERLINSRTGN